MTLANHPPLGLAPAPRRRPAGAPSLSRFLRLRRRLAARAAALAVPALLALAAPAAAQAATLVSNLGKSSGSAVGLNEKDVAVQFTTGGGSSFTAIVLDFSSAPSGVTVKVGTGQPHNLTSPVTLTNPTTFASGNNTFTADAGTKLTASTTYWVVIEGTGGALWLTANDGEDTGAATGWSIADDSRSRDAGLTGPFASTVLTNIPKFRVEGTVFTKPGKPAAPSVTTGSTTSLKVAWRAPASDGGDAITDYDVRWRERFATTWNAIADTSASTATRTTVTGLSAGKTYDVQVCAQNSVNSSACADADWSPSTQGKTYAGTSLPLSGAQCATCPAVPTAAAHPGPGVGEITVE